MLFGCGFESLLGYYDYVENSEFVQFMKRSPYPMLHLLREESISKVAGDPEELLQISRRNIETLKAMGIAKIRERLK